MLKILELPSNQETISERNLLLILKYGFDGSSGHSAYKQKWNDDAVSDDQNVFVTSIVPLRLQNVLSGKIIWENPRPCSTRFCRPIRIQWLHETNDIARAEKEFIQDQINNLQAYSKELWNVELLN